MIDFLNLENQADVIEAFNLTSRYLDGITNITVMRQSACLVFNPITFDNYAAFFNCTPVGQASDSMMAPTYSSFSWLGAELLVCCLAHRGSTCFFLSLRVSVYGRPGISIVGQLTESVSPRFLFIMVVVMIYLTVLDGSFVPNCTFSLTS